MFQIICKSLGTILTNRNEVHDGSGRKTTSGNVWHSVQKLKILSTFQNAINQYVQNNFASITYGCEKCFLTLREEHKLQGLETKLETYLGQQTNKG
jgi:hypothetical protein